jgi:hypothetical protein
MAGLSDTEDDSDNELQEIFITRKAREQAAERHTEGNHTNPHGDGETAHQHRCTDQEETAQNQAAAYQSDVSERAAGNSDHNNFQGSDEDGEPSQPRYQKRVGAPQNCRCAEFLIQPHLFKRFF